MSPNGQRPVITRLACLCAVAFLVAWPMDKSFSEPQKKSLDYVSISGAQNPSPVQDGECGVVTHDYEISTTELTNSEYVEFLTATARFADPYALYSPLMSSHFWGGIVRISKNSQYIYLVKQGYERRPLTFVSWTSAIRYVNWLHFKKPDTGHARLGSTEGSRKVGAYDTTSTPTNFQRNPGAVFFLPTCDEWSKAAYFEPSKHALQPYATGPNEPNAGGQRVENGRANYFKSSWAEVYPHIVQVGSYPESASPSGTHDQNGNVMEWTQDADGAQRLALGGSLFMGPSTLRRGYRDSEFPEKQLSSFGFRVAGTPGSFKSLPNSPIDKRALLRTEEYSPYQKTYTSTPSASTINAPSAAAEWIRVGHPGNLPDPYTGYGCVDKEFEIQKNELSNAQYANFLNSVARVGDPHELYTPDLATGVLGGIFRTGDAGSYAYHVKPGLERRSVAYLSWTALARFANWMQFKMPDLGTSTLGSTEGTDKIGAYDTRKFAINQKSKSNYTNTDLKRNAGAEYFIPSNDEWYKAAYFDPSRSVFFKYWNYPNLADSPPPNAPSSEFSQNYQTSGDLGEGPPYYLAPHDKFKSPPGHAQDMGGSLWEWVEDWKSLGEQSCWRCDQPVKGLRGGSFNYVEIGLSRKNIDPGLPNDRYFVYGGRLARAIPGAASSSCLLQTQGLSSQPLFAKMANRLLNGHRTLELLFLCTSAFIILALIGAPIILMTRRLNRRGRATPGARQ